MKRSIKQLLSAVLVIAMIATLLVVPAAVAAEGDLTGAIGDEWSFIKSDWAGGVTEYKGLTFSQAFGKNGDQHGMDAKSGTITIPVQGPCNIEVVPSYKWDLTIGTTNIKGAPNGENTTPYVVSYAGGASTVTLTINDQSYIRSIAIRELKATLATSTAEVVVTEGENGSFTATVSGAGDAEVTWDAYEVGSDAIVSNVAVTNAGAVSFKGAKVGGTKVAVKATVGEEAIVKEVEVYVKPTTIGDVKDGSYIFAAADGKTTFRTTEDVTISSGWKYHGTEHGLTNSGADTISVKIPEGKKANVTLVTCCFGGTGITSMTEDELSQGTVEEGDATANTWTLTAVSGTVGFTAPASGSVYIHGLQVELMDANADTMSVSRASVSMRAKESVQVTATVDGYAGKSVFAVSADESKATVAVTDKTVTITGVAEGKTTVYVVMADAQPTLAQAVANDSAKAVAVTVTAPLAEGTKEWVWGGSDGSHSADTFEKDSEGLTMPGLEAVKYHNSYGLLAKPKMAEDGTTIELAAKIGIPVEGPSKITVTVGYTWDISLGDAQAPERYGRYAATSGNNGSEQAQVFNYYGSAGTVTLTAYETTSTYIYAIKVEPAADVAAASKVAVWDLQGAQLDATMFDNKLDVEAIKAFYQPSEQWPDSKVPTLGSFATADGEFAFEAEASDKETMSYNGVRNDYRLRTANEALKDWVHSTNNYTKNDVAAGEDPYDPALTSYGVSFQSNGGVMTFKFKAEAGDKLTFTYANASTSDGAIFMDYIDAADAASGKVTKTLENKKGAGNGNIASVYVAASGIQTLTHGADPDGAVQKPGVARFYRETPTTVTISGALRVGAGVTESYKLIATDDVSGVEYEATITDGAYSVDVNNYISGTSFTLSVEGPEGYIVGSGAEVTVAPGAVAVSNDIDVIKVDLVTVSGTVTGLEAADLADLVITVGIPEDKIYVPKIIPGEDGTYTAKLEKGVAYTLTAKNVNDYALGVTDLNKSADETGVALPFTAKPVYAVTVTPIPADVDLSAVTFTFTNFSEIDDKHPNGYIYTFTGAGDIKLRDGQYKVKLDGAPLPTKLISDLKVAGAAATKEITFLVETPTKWVFTKEAFTADVLAAKEFNKLLLDGVVAREEKDHAIMKDTGKMSVPVDGPCEVHVTVYYAAAGTIGVGDDTVPMVTDVSTGTTGSSDTIIYTYTGEGAGYVDVIATDTTYVLSIEVVKRTPYAETVTVGKDKDYQTIQAAVDAVTKMDRPNGERVTIMIDPGNYEEMVWVKTPNVTFKNAAANPSIALKNKGIDIEDGAVRITWYYGCGFDYYSMGPNSKFSAEQLAVNKENGYVSHPNSAGGGSNNECWWNATTVIAAKGFRAENIIFENSFNQYVSAAAAADVIVPNGGAKEDATKPRADLPLGSTEVQRKAYVERAAAIALANDVTDEAFFDHCAFVGHQDVIYGGRAVKAGFYNCDVMGACDYIFGPMTAVFAKCDMVLNVGADDDANDVAYITAPQNASDVHGYLMYNCNVRNVEPGVESAGAAKSAYQHMLGRAWSGASAEAIFFETTVGTNAKGESLIAPEGWNTGLGSSQICAEYHTHEEAAEADHTKRIFGGFLEAPETKAGASLTDYAGWLAGWDPFVGKRMTPICPDAPVDTTELEQAIADAYALGSDVTVMPVGTDPATVTKGQKFADQATVDALAQAIAAAKAVLANEKATQAEVYDAVDALNAAVDAFNAAVKTGTKGTSGSVGVGGSVGGGRPATGTTTYKNANGDTVKKTVDVNGNVTITVTDENGEVLANVELPASVSALTKKFKDVPDGHWAEKSINTLAALGMVKGVADEVYDMTSPVTRGSLATILFRLAQAKGAASDFSDVAADAWYADAVGWAAKAGIVNGNGDGTFAADASITREQLAAMLYRFAKLLGVDTKAAGSLADFADGDATSDWATEAMTWAVGAGILKGNGAKELNPTVAASRAETACMVDRLLGLIK